MLQQIADLVEFDLTRFGPEQVIDDFNHKFAGSILKVNGQYYKTVIAKLRNNKAELVCVNTEGNEVKFTNTKSIEKVLPKTGLYSSEYGLLYLYRLPKRQWIKSLSIGNNYRVEVLSMGINGDVPTIWDTVLVEHPEYKKETAIYQNKVYLHWKAVGKVKDNIIYVTKSKFLEEIKELWNPQYQIILDVNHLQPKVEKLILDW